jgi:hypothetical protein
VPDQRRDAAVSEASGLRDVAGTRHLTS